MRSFVSGLLFGGLLTYIAFQSHVVRTVDGVAFVPKQPAIPLSDTYADVRSWTAADWQQHPRLYEAMKQADRLPAARPAETEATAEQPAPSGMAPVPVRGPAAQPRARAVSYPEQTQMPSRGATTRDRQAQPVATTPPLRRIADAAEEVMQEPSRAINAEVDSFENEFLEELDRVFMESRQGLSDGMDRTRQNFLDEDRGADQSVDEPFRSSRNGGGESR